MIVYEEENSIPVECPCCHERIGYLVDVDGADYLLIGGGIAREWHGYVHTVAKNYIGA